MSDAAALDSSLRALRDRVAEVPVADAVSLVVEACVDMFRVRGSGLMLADERGELHYVAASDGPGRLLEKLQADADEGPCVSTFLDDDVVLTEDLENDPRWPSVAAGIRGLNVRAVVGVPVHLAGSTVGSLDIYRDVPRPWTGAEVSALRRYAAVIEVVLATAVRAERSGEVVGQLQYALDYRVPIERGIGYLMARDGLSSTQAFSVLRTAARSSRRKVVAVAEQLLTSGSLPGER